MVADVLDRFQIVGKKDLYPSQLSGGQQQLVGVARAVIANPQVILADEPTGNLHSAQGKEIMELFRALNEAGTTIIQVTHSEVNASYGNRVIQLRDGWVVGGEPARRRALTVTRAIGHAARRRRPRSPTISPTCSRPCGSCSRPRAIASNPPAPRRRSWPRSRPGTSTRS